VILNAVKDVKSKGKVKSGDSSPKLLVRSLIAICSFHQFDLHSIGGSLQLPDSASKIERITLCLRFTVALGNFSLG